MIKNKTKQIEERLRRLKMRVEGMEAQASEDSRRMQRLGEQVQCGVVGHKFQFDCKRSFRIAGPYYVFKCRCGLDILKSTSQLTAKEKTALRALKIL